MRLVAKDATLHCRVAELEKFGVNPVGLPRMVTSENLRTTRKPGDLRGSASGVPTSIIELMYDDVNGNKVRVGDDGLSGSETCVWWGSDHFDGLGLVS